MRHTIKLILLSIFLFTGCNSSKSKTKENNQNELFTYNNSTVNNHSNKNNLTLTGKVIDGEIKGATVFLDLNRNDKIDNGEPNTTTESDGSFTLILYESHQQHKNYLNHTAPLVAFGGTDIRTGNKFQDYLLSMTEGNLVVNITPLTTLITQSLKEEIKKDSNKLFQKTTEELQSDIDKKIAGIKKNISELLGIREDLLTKNPIALVKEGDNSLLNTSLQLQKTAQEMKKAMKKKVRGLKHSILYSYRSLGRELQKLEKKANKSKESALIEALDSAMNDSSVFNEDLVEDIKNGSKELIKSINNFWSGDKEILDDNDLNEAVKRLEVIVDDGESILTEIPTPTPTVILTPTPTAIPTPTPIVISTPTPTVIPTETPTPISINTNIPSNIDDATAIRFLNKATFGANKESIEDLKFKGVVAWLNEQLNLPLNDNQYLIKMIELAKKMSPNENSYTIKEYFADNDIMFNHDIASFQSPRYRMSSWFDIALTSKDQLRQKVTYALSQIIVESDFEPIFKRRAEALATYFDILQRNAFGNYKDLLNEISLSSGMGVFLTFNGNKKKYQNEANVTVYPDENYAREIMQLFSIGLMKLNIDGTPIFNNGKPIPTYTQNDVNELARVFTGWDLKRNNKYGKVGIKRGDYTHPLEFTPDYHDNGEKKLLGKTIPAGLTGEQDIQKAIDIIMSNSSVAPFISKQLIMRLTKSNPSKNYVQRVAEVFTNSGGNLKEVVKAIFLDEELWDDIENKRVIKFKEPLIAYTSFLRTFNAKPFPSWYFCGFDAPSDDNASNCQVVKNSFLFNDTRDFLNQGPGLAPTVFNFYDNNFIPNNPEFKEDKLVAPEIQIQSDTVFINFSNQIRNNLVHWEKNYLLNLGHQNYKVHNDKERKRYDTLEAYVKDAPKRRYTTVQYIGVDKMLLDTSEELNVMEKVIDGDTDGDFKNLKDFRNSNDNLDKNSVETLVKHLNQKLTGGLLTTEKENIIIKNLKDGIFDKYHKNATVNITGYEDTSKYNKKRQLLNDVIFPAIRAIVTSSVYMTE